MLAMMLVSCVLGAVAEPLTAVPFTDVTVEDTFWAPRLEAARQNTLPANFKWCEDTGRIGNFQKASGAIEGKFEGIYFNDSDVYKVIEGASYMLHASPDPKLDAYLDDLIAKIAAAQQPDGYLNTYFTLVEPDKRWADLPVKHELYCAGHMFEAAVAHYRATGKRTFLDVACRFADYIDSVFGPGKKYGVPGHEEIELALVKLYQATGERRYLDLAKFFIDERGRTDHRASYGDYCQDHLPVRNQREIAGHAVRAMYLYSGVADVARLTGDQPLVDTMDRIWDDVVLRKMYITGGIGPSAKNEGFTVAYDLPNDSAYAETCASIGMALWNHRLNLLHADAKYADIVEQVAYNGLLSGLALDGEHYFYVNPLASRGAHNRQPWFGCACCPTNLVRWVPSLPGYVYARDKSGLYVNLYVAGSGKVSMPRGEVTISQQTNYPWDGAIRLTFMLPKPATFTLNLRIPGWCENYTVAVDAHSLATEVGTETLTPPVRNGYARIERRWAPGDTITLNLAMPVRRVYANPHVAADVGRVALQRGPIVYCLEGMDNAGRVRSMALPPDEPVTAEYRPDLLGGVTVLTGRALARLPENWNGAAPARLYKTGVAFEEVDFTAVPYCVWDNRDPGPMVVWLPEAPSLAEEPPIPTIANQSRASATHVQGDLEALADGIEPANSNDQAVPRFTWWDHKGTTEWVEYAFAKPAEVRAVDVYWFDDTGAGGCRVPAEWQLLYRDGTGWKPVEKLGTYGIAPNQYNHVKFQPVKTEALRLVAKLQNNFSAGILEWRVLD
ncbi:MAG TPA: beta-L-arabinofuranosidase domain-containing protein [Candidatus Bathyarchaeia archaeon]|nr:beta-L-arabinofuranosidase domain-containing protein [Candidatus Bathyarchaeia archaeon]